MLIDKELFAIAADNLRHECLRSYLTLLGIVVGIAAIVALASIGTGLNEAVASQFEKIGLDIIYIEPGSGGFTSSAVARTIKEDDIKTIESIPGVEAAMGFYETAGIATYKKESASVFLIGIDPKKISYLEKTGMLDLKKGRALNENDKYAILIPESFAKDGLKHEIGLRQKTEISGEEFTVVGIIKDSDIAFSGLGQINMVWTTKKTLKEVFDVADPMEIAVKAMNKNIVDEVAAKIEARLEKEHGEKDFQVMTTENIIQTVNAVLGVIQVVLIGLASISLVVGGIGIMNTMLMAVMERTKEIGIMKAIGATNNRVLALFLAESGLLGLIGGMLGIILGLLIALGVSIAATQLGFAFPFALNIAVIAGALAFSMLIGIISGVLPARRAALLEPVEALRHGT